MKGKVRWVLGSSKLLTAGQGRVGEELEMVKWRSEDGICCAAVRWKRQVHLVSPFTSTPCYVHVCNSEVNAIPTTFHNSWNQLVSESYAASFLRGASAAKLVRIVPACMLLEVVPVHENKDRASVSNYPGRHLIYRPILVPWKHTGTN